MSNAHALRRTRRRRPLPPHLRVMIAATVGLLACLAYMVLRIAAGQANASTVFFLCLDVAYLTWSWPKLIEVWDWWRRG